MAHNMANQQYSLRWSNHTDNILTALDTLLQSENLVDVTLICGKDSLRAHRVILSACSPFFQKIFAETPCNHPVVVLNEFQGAEVQALINFMYRGEVSVAQTRLDALMKAAESLQIRGLADNDKNSPKHPDPVHAVVYEGDESGCGGGYLHQPCSLGPRNTARSPVDRSTPVRIGSVSPSSSSTYEPATKQPRHTYMDTTSTRSECISPTPRRKQARPRRRSGDNCSVQDLSTNSPKSPQPQEDVAENLCIKKTEERSVQPKRELCTETTSTPDLPRTPDIEIRDYRTSPISLPQPPLNMNQEMDNHPHLSFPPMPSVSALAMTPPQGKYFGLDAQPLGLFPPGLENCRTHLFEMDHRAQDHHGLVKKKMGRPKGQHSAPRGGPPRSWTNSELTEALQHVWNKKMTTSQASRIFGIPYNSLLMYVRGKYGKSLKLEQLRKDCIGAPNATAELMSMSTPNNNNTVVKNEREPEPVQPNTRPSSAENQPPPAHPHFLNPFMTNFYPDFNSFPLPMMHQFLPQGERSREHFSNQAHQPQSQPQHQSEVDNSNSEALEEDAERFRSPTRSIEERRDVVQQNGQD
ncbi:protein jim lovell isoform X2 [Coccinella septempunctata]|uniref:protein jim lovell isoform X2 n=1 Tax=Coccinella septempunctata TaxID=41139 RepID=UPI001D092960|nr:protein jim lovell isoform X2 [Coccinella septempunctata]